MALLVPTVIYASQEMVDTDKISNNAEYIMSEQVLPNLKIAAIQDDELIAESNSDGGVEINTVRYIGLNSSAQDNKTYLHFFGSQVQPDTVITLSLPADDIVRSTAVDAAGNWEIKISLNTLTTPVQSSYIQVKNGEQLSNEYEVSKFSIQRAQALSDDTWIFLISAFGAFVAILLAVTIQVRHNMRPQPGMLY